jgi:hypothetical protein
MASIALKAEFEQRSVRRRMLPDDDYSSPRTIANDSFRHTQNRTPFHLFLPLETQDNQSDSTVTEIAANKDGVTIKNLFLSPFSSSAPFVCFSTKPWIL